MTGQNDLERVTFLVNGKTCELMVEPYTTLQSALHQHLGYREVRYGCGEGVCGACAVLVDGQPVASCLLLALQAEGRQIVTAEGLAKHFSQPDGNVAENLRAQFVGRQSFQCGYCSCGILVSAAYHAAAAPTTAEETKSALAGNICRCTGYQQIIEATIAASRQEKPPDPRFERTDLKIKMGPSAGYPTDRKKDAALIGRILWSQFPSARLISINTSAALAVPDVEAVLTYRDIPGKNFTGAVAFGVDQPLLAMDQVRSSTDAVALVIARNEGAAAEALARIQVQYEQSTPLTNMADALKPGAKTVGACGNITAQFVQESGNVDKAFAEADVIVTGEYTGEMNDHACMELEGGTGWIEDDVLVLTVPHQTPESGQRNVARMLGIDPAKVRIVAENIGGSFGKYAAFTIEGYLGLLVHHARKPVRLVLGRDEILQRRSKRHPSAGTYKLGMKKDGTFLAMEASILTDSGPYVGLTPAVAAVIGAEASGAYTIPNVRARVRGVFTNNLPTIPMRGYGSQQISFGVESIVEHAAHQLGMDPAELRRHNYKKFREDGYGNPIPGKDLWLAQTLECVSRSLGPRPKPPAGWLHGRGFATIHAKYGYPYGMVDRFVVKVAVDAQGVFRVESDIADSGTAVPMQMVNVLAQDLGLSSLPQYVQSRAAMDDPSGVAFASGRNPSWLGSCGYRLIEWVQTTAAKMLLAITGRFKKQKNLALFQKIIARPTNLLIWIVNGLKSWLYPFSRESFQPRYGSSRALSMCAAAVLDAAQQLRKKALKLAAAEFKVSANELQVEPDGIYCPSLSRSISWTALAAQCGGDLSALGQSQNLQGPLLEGATGNQTGAIDFMDASHGCDLLVNVETGQVRILKYVACHDVGHAFNREALRGQILGGITMGIGQALHESLQMQNGKVMNNGLHDYLVATSADLPDEISVELLESGNGMGPFGSKGIGESGAVASPIAVTNAIYDALGTQLPVIPSTPDMIAEIARQKISLAG